MTEDLISQDPAALGGCDQALLYPLIWSQVTVCGHLTWWAWPPREGSGDPPIRLGRKSVCNPVCCEAATSGVLVGMFSAVLPGPH